MSKSRVMVQVPLKPELHTKLKQRADDLGFDSVQAYIRFWAAAETSELNRSGVSNYGDLLSPKLQALRLFELVIAQHRDGLPAHAYIMHAIKVIRLREMDKLFKLAGMRVRSG